MTARSPLLAAALLLLPAGLAAQSPFEGVVTYRMTAMGQEGTVRYMAKGTRIRQEMELPQMPGMMFMLMDTESSVMRTVMPGMGMYMEIDLDQASRYLTGEQQEAAENMAIEKLGTSDVIAGIRCENYRVGPPADSEVCMASGMGWFMSAPSPRGRRGAAGGPDFSAFRKHFKDGALPLRVIQIRGDTREVMMEATSVERKSLDAALFELPAGLQKMTMPGGD